MRYINDHRVRAPLRMNMADYISVGDYIAVGDDSTIAPASPGDALTQGAGLTLTATDPASNPALIQTPAQIAAASAPWIKGIPNIVVILGAAALAYAAFGGKKLTKNPGGKSPKTALLSLAKNSARHQFTASDALVRYPDTFASESDVRFAANQLVTQGRLRRTEDGWARSGRGRN